MPAGKAQQAHGLPPGVRRLRPVTVEMEEKKPVIAIKNLSFSYDGRAILEDVFLDIYHRDSVCIVGPNGGGKSTLVKLIIGLLSAPQGEIRVFGKTPQDSRLRIGYVPQYAHYDPLFPISVRDVVRMGRLGKSFLGHYSREDSRAALAALEEMGLADHRSHRFSALSGGQRQRVLIARALASGGEILILDEPTANIDPHTEEHLFEILTELNKRLTIMLVTHDVGFASQFFKRVVCVNRRVVIHPTSALTGKLISEMYGSDLHLIRHDHHCTLDGHSHD